MPPPLLFVLMILIPTTSTIVIDMLHFEGLELLDDGSHGRSVFGFHLGTTQMQVDEWLVVVRQLGQLGSLAGDDLHRDLQWWDAVVRLLERQTFVDDHSIRIH